jgi:hypothetical protein
VFTFGFAFLAPLHIFGKVSAKLNPAMCLAQWVWGNLTGVDFVCLSLAEFAGAFAGGLERTQLVAQTKQLLHQLLYFLLLRMLMCAVLCCTGCTACRTARPCLCRHPRTKMVDCCGDCLFISFISLCIDNFALHAGAVLHWLHYLPHYKTPACASTPGQRWSIAAETFCSSLLYPFALTVLHCTQVLCCTGCTTCRTTRPLLVPAPQDKDGQLLRRLSVYLFHNSLY